MRLTAENFFHYYIFHCNAVELNKKEQLTARICSVALGILTVGIVHLICKIAFYSHSFKIRHSNSNVSDSASSKMKSASPVKIPTPLGPPVFPKTHDTVIFNPSNPPSSEKIDSPKLSDFASPIIKGVSPVKIPSPSISPKTHDTVIFNPNNPSSNTSSSNISNPNENTLIDHTLKKFDSPKPEASPPSPKANPIIETSLNDLQIPTISLTPSLPGNLKDAPLPDPNNQSSADVSNKNENPLTEPIIDKPVPPADEATTKNAEPEALPHLLTLIITDPSLQEPMNYQSNKSLDTILSETPASHYIYPNPELSNLIDPKTKKNLNDRIEAFDKAIQFKTRVKLNLLNTIVHLADLIAPWEHSLLRYKLMQDDELPQLTISHVKNIPMDELLKINARILIKAHRFPSAIPIDLNKDNIDNLALIQIPKLPLATLMDLYKDRILPSFTISLLPIKTLVQLDFSEIVLEKKLFDAIFKERIISSLTLKQIDSINHFCSLKHWGYLSEKQICELNLSKLPVDVLSTIFSSIKNKTKNCIAKLPPESIYFLIKNKIFEKNHCDFLTADQVLQLDFSQIPADLLSKILATTYSRDKIKNIISKSTNECIYYLIKNKFFTKWHCDFLTVDQILQMDFSQIPADLLSEIFGARHNRNKIKDIISKSTNGSIDYLIKNKLFKEWHFDFLTSDQVLQLDFSQASKELLSKIFCFNNDKTKKLISQLTVANFNILLQQKIINENGQIVKFSKF